MLRRARKHQPNRLRELRELKNWTQADLAEQLQVSTSTISRAESGSAGALQTIKFEAARLLGTSVDDLGATATDPSQTASPHIVSFLAMLYAETSKPVRAPKPERIDDLTETTLFSAQSAVHDRIVRHLCRASSTGIIVWDSRDPLPTGERYQTLLTAMDHFSCKQQLTSLIRLGGPTEHRMKLLAFGLQTQVRRAMLPTVAKRNSGLVCRFLKSTGLHRFPADFALFGNTYVIALPTAGLYSVDRGFEAQVGHEVIAAHLKCMADHALQVADLFEPDKVVEWIESVTTSTAGAIDLVQTFLPWASRPPTEFHDSSSPWSQRARVAIGNDELRGLVLAKQRAFSRFAEGLRKNRFRQICDFETVASWWRDGSRLDVPVTDPLSRDKRPQRRQRLDKTIEYLEQHTLFELGLVNGFRRVAVTEHAAQRMSWQAVGDDHLMVEAQVPRKGVPTAWQQQIGAGNGKLGILIRDEEVVTQARRHFDTLWTDPTVQRNKQRVLEQFRWLREQPQTD